MSDETIKNQLAEVIRQRDTAERALSATQARLDDYIAAIADLTIDRMRLQRQLYELRGERMWTEALQKPFAKTDVTSDDPDQFAAAARAAREIAALREQLQAADADRIPLRMDLDEVKARPDRAIPLIMAATGRWAEIARASREALGPSDALLLEAVEAYEAACSAAANDDDSI